MLWMPCRRAGKRHNLLRVAVPAEPVVDAVAAIVVNGNEVVVPTGSRCRRSYRKMSAFPPAGGRTVANGGSNGISRVRPGMMVMLRSERRALCVLAMPRAANWWVQESKDADHARAQMLT